MREINNKSGAFISVVVILVLTFLMIFILSDDITFWNIVKRLPTAVTIYGLILIVFVKWLWKCRIFKGWLVLIPDLSGEWTGKLKTTYTGTKTGKKKRDIKIDAIIKQELFSVSVTMKTKEMKSYSYVAGFDIDNKQNRNKICYSYTSKPRPEYREGSPIHDGTALLDIIGNPPTKLEGEYWTTRRTTGTIELERS